MSQKLQNDAKSQKCQLDNLVDFEKCCKTHIYLQKSVPIQPKTSNILPKRCSFQGPRYARAWTRVRAGARTGRLVAGLPLESLQGETELPQTWEN